MESFRRGLARRDRLVTLLASSALFATLTGCDPCAGLVSCGGDRTLRAGGWIVDRADGEGAAGVRVGFNPLDGGPALPAVTSTAEGRWETSIAAAGRDSVRGVFRVEAPGELPYETDTLTVRAFASGGGEELGRWTTAPFFAFAAELRFPDQQRRPARVRFKRTDGAAAAPATHTLTADPFGRFFLELDLLEADAIVAEFRIEHADLPSPVTIEDVRIPFKYHDEALPLDRVLRVGPSLEYVGRLWRRRAGGHVPAVDVDMEFRRIGGIRVEPEVKRSTTVFWGGFNLVLGTYQRGAVRGELSGFLPPSGERVVLDTLTLATFETDELREAGEWVFGHQIHYAIGLRDPESGDPAVGVPVTFVRTGGLPAEPGSIQTVTDEDGRFLVGLDVEGPGEVVGELRVGYPGAPMAVIPDVRLEAREDDEVHFLGWLQP